MFAFLISLIDHYGHIGIFLSIFIENMGVPLPTEAGYIVAQAMINRGVVTYWEAFFILYAGYMVGSIISYWAGRRIARTIKTRESLSEVQQKLASWYDKYGYYAVLGGRLIGYVRPWSSYVAGIAEVPFWPFFWLTALGSFIINFLCLYFTEQVLYIWENYEGLRLLIALSFSVGFIFLILAGHSKRKNRKKTTKAI